MRTPVLALALLFAGAAVAQAPATTTPATAESRGARMMDDLTVLLDLTDAQKAQVQTILQAQHAEMKASFEQAKASGTKPDWAQMKAQHEQMEQETVTKLTPVLSASQLQKFQVLQKMEHGHHRGPPPGAPPPQ